MNWMTSEADWLTRRLIDQGDPIISDGGMGTQLEKAGVAMHGKVWSG
jgi:S-methylmethionine-dependent homocysteine/selenocysteine methylase